MRIAHPLLVLIDEDLMMLPVRRGTKLGSIGSVPSTFKSRERLCPGDVAIDTAENLVGVASALVRSAKFPLGLYSTGAVITFRPGSVDTRVPVIGAQDLVHLLDNRHLFKTKEEAVR